LRGRSHRLIRRVLVAVAGLLLLLGIPATGPAQAPGVGTLKQKSAALAARSRAAVVDLYALESRLQQTRADLARLDAHAAELARRQASAKRSYRAARKTMAVAQQRLGQQLRLLYEQGEPDPIAVLLGAASLEQAIEGLDNIKRIARATQSVLEQARSARHRVQLVRRQLAVQVGRTNAARERVAAGAAELERARGERTAYLTQLRSEQALTASQIASLEQRAQEAQQRAQQVTQQATQQAATQQPAQAASPVTQGTAAAPAETTTEAVPAPGPSEPPPAPVESVSQGTQSSAPTTTGPPRPGGTMSVLATGYCLKGTTATGLPVGPGIVAVDPTAIPLGTRMTIPGYGEGVAADTGNGIRGARIDVWIASCAEAIKFNRTVTITFH
jgi:3D (Asp-Asp-Asp) domain-containing protein/peptidoglycan hydrolase CwlO-like protein